MSDRFTQDTFAYNRDDFRRDRGGPDDDFPPLPTWIQAKHLGEGEVVEWVRGPRWAPEMERYLTHPLLFVVALALGAVSIFAGASAGGPKSPELGVGVGAALTLVIGSIFVLGFFSGYFTRLVVTNQRVAILQGYELVRVWKMDDLPPSMIRYRAGESGERSPTIDLSTVKTMLGGSPDGFADAKTILAFGKQLNNIVKGRDDKGR